MGLRQIIRQAIITLLFDDTSAYPRGQAKYNGKVTEYIPVSPYGLFGKAPLSSWVLLLSSNRQEAVKFGLESDFLSRKKGLLSGECGLYNTVTGAIIWLKADGSVEIESKLDLDLTVAGNTNLTNTGNLTANVTGTATLNGTGAILVAGSAAVTVTSATNIALTATGAVNITGGTVTLLGTTTIEGKAWLSHIHSGVTGGVSNSGPVV